MNQLTAEEFVKAIQGTPVRLLPEPPRDLVQPGEVIVWPSFTADYTDQGKHIEAVVYPSVQVENACLVMVSKRVYAALGGV